MKNRLLLMAAMCLMLGSCSEDKEKVEVKLDAIKLYPTMFELKSDKSTRLELDFAPANYVPQKAPKWSSSDISVATVDDTGLISALKVGTAIIMVQLEGKSASSNIAVLQSDPVVPKPNPAPVFSVTPESFSFSPSHIGLEVPLRLEVRPKSTDISAVKWESSDPEIATVDNKGVFKIVGKTGTCYITAKLNEFIKSSSTVYVFDLK